MHGNILKYKNNTECFWSLTVPLKDDPRALYMPLYCITYENYAIHLLFICSLISDQPFHVDFKKIGVIIEDTVVLYKKTLLN